MGGLEWVLIALAVMLLFGARRIPQLARGIGQGISEFRKARDGGDKESDKSVKDKS